MLRKYKLSTMQEKISLKIAANDKIKLIEEKVFITKLFLGILVATIIFSFIGIALQIGIILSLILIWIYKQDKKELKRMRETYGL